MALSTLNTLQGAVFRNTGKPSVAYLDASLWIWLKADSTGEVTGTTFSNPGTLGNASMARGDGTGTYPIVDTSVSKIGEGSIYFNNPSGIVTGGFVDLPNFTMGTHFSLSFWTKCPAGGFPANARLFDFGVGYPHGGSNCLAILSTNTGRPTIYCGSTFESTSNMSNIQTNSWIHHVFVFTRTTKEVKIYRNNNLANTLTMTTAIPSTTRTSNFIGRSGWGGSDKTYNGWMDDVRFYNLALTDTDVNNLYLQ